MNEAVRIGESMGVSMVDVEFALNLRPRYWQDKIRNPGNSRTSENLELELKCIILGLKVLNKV